MTAPEVDFGWHMLNASLAANGTNGSLAVCYDYFEPYCFDDAYFFLLAPFKLTTAKIVSAFFMALLIVVSLSGNALVCVAFYQYRRLRTITNYYVISLAVSDIMVGSLAMPLWLSYEVSEWRNLPTWIEYTSLTKVWETMDILSAVSSIVNLTIISVDRFFSIMYPLRHRNFMNPRRAMFFLSCGWLYSLTISLCNIHRDFKGFPAFSATMGFFLPLVIIIASYTGIFVRMRQRRGVSSDSRRLEKEIRVARTILIVVSLFIICWLPFFLFSMIYHYCRTCIFNHVALIYAVSIIKWMQYLNSCCNPFVYGFFNANFKQAFQSLFKQCCTRGAHYFPSDSSDPDKNDRSSIMRRYTSSIRRCTKRITDSFARPESMQANSCSTVNTIATTTTTSDVRASFVRTKSRASRTSSETSQKQLSTVNEMDSFAGSMDESSPFMPHRVIIPEQEVVSHSTNKYHHGNGVVEGSPDCNGNGLALLLGDAKESDV